MYSLINLTMHLFLLLDIGVIGPQMSAWISWSIWEALNVLTFGNEFLCCLPTRQSLHTLEGVLSWGKPFTIYFCWRVLNPWKFKWLYLQCQRCVWSSVTVLKHTSYPGWETTSKKNILLGDIPDSIIRPLSGWKILHFPCWNTILSPFCWNCPMLSKLFFSSAT